MQEKERKKKKRRKKKKEQRELTPHCQLSQSLNSERRYGATLSSDMFHSENSTDWEMWEKAAGWRAGETEEEEVEESISMVTFSQCHPPLSLQRQKPRPSELNSDWLLHHQ
ncbi:uncharacterized [Tachysurus ichikawai]